jgi:hypothetical protein
MCLTNCHEDPSASQPVVSRYTDYATMAFEILMVNCLKHLKKIHHLCNLKSFDKLGGKTICIKLCCHLEETVARCTLSPSTAAIFCAYV